MNSVYEFNCESFWNTIKQFLSKNLMVRLGIDTDEVGDVIDSTVDELWKLYAGQSIYFSRKTHKDAREKDSVLVSEWKQGKVTYEQLAHKYGLSTARVRQIIREQSQPKENAARQDDELEKAVLSEWEQGKTNKEIALELSITSQKVIHVLKMHGRKGNKASGDTEKIMVVADVVKEETVQEEEANQPAIQMNQRNQAPQGGFQGNRADQDEFQRNQGRNQRNQAPQGGFQGNRADQDEFQRNQGRNQRNQAPQGGFQPWQKKQ